MRARATPNAFGWESSKDLDAAIAFLTRRPDIEDGRIGGLGLSVGGELMIETAALNPALRAVVSEGAGERSVRESALLGAGGWLNLPMATVQTAAVALFSGDLPPPALDDAAAQVAPRPLFLIYGSSGQAVRGWPPAAALSPTRSIAHAFHIRQSAWETELRVRLQCRARRCV